MNFTNSDDKIKAKGSAVMSTVQKDALIAEIAEICAYSAPTASEPLITAPASYRRLFSSFQLGYYYTAFKPETQEKTLYYCEKRVAVVC